MTHNWVRKKIGGRYLIETLLGQGGMSAVYKASDPNLRRKVAIKLIHPHLSLDPNFVGRFKEEAAAVARLRHPNIVQVHDFNVDGETYYMVMEYLVGETLQTRLRRLNATGRYMPLDEAVNLCIQLCEATGYAHNHELVHRDIKPANIMLNVDGQAILMDFGIVKIIGGDYHTSTGATIGTAMYMSPEQIRSNRVDERADIYSLGVTLYEMLSGQPPYMADSSPTLMMMVLNDPLPDLREARKGVPDNLLVVVNKALAKDPNERFQTMAEFASALRQVQIQIASEPSALAATQVDESEYISGAAPSAAATDSGDEPTELETQKDSQAVNQMGIMSTELEIQQQVQDEPAVSTPQGGSVEVVPARTPSTASKSGTTARLITPRNLLVTFGIVVMAIVITLSLQYMNTRKPPDAELAPISRPLDRISTQTAQMVVSLGRWETGSFIEELAYSPDSSLLGTAINRERARFSQYRFYNALWQVQAGSLQHYLLGHTLWVYDIAFSPDGQLVGSASDDGSVLIWQVPDGKLVRKIESSHGGLTSLAFSSNNLLLAAGTGDGTIDLWQVDNGNLLRILQEDDYSIEDVGFSPDNTLLAAASYNNSILLWQVSDGRLVRILQDHTAPVSEVVFSPDGLLLASASEDHTIKIWRVSDGSLLQSMRGHTEAVLDVTISPDSSLLASSSSDGKLLLWQVSNGELLSTLTDNSDSITSVAFSPDGLLLASGTEEGVIQFWGISEAISQDTDEIKDW